MVANELVLNRKAEAVGHVIVDERVSRKCETVTDGFVVFRMPRSDRGVPRGSYKAKPVKAKPVKAAGKRGRPRVYNGTHRRIVAGFLKKFGLTKAIKLLATERNLKVSLTLAQSVAEEFGIKFKMGRPAA
jgi:hypothetical protein